MKKITFGAPEKHTPTVFCDNLNYVETQIIYPVEKILFKTSPRGCTLILPLKRNEHIYGCGLQTALFDLIGKKLTLRVNADCESPVGDSHAPVPFFVSTAGYGIYVDTARYAEFYFGSSALLKQEKSVSNNNLMDSVEELYQNNDTGDNISIHIPTAKGVDIYIFEGDSITNIVSQYNMFSGGGCDCPEWGLAPFFRMYVEYTDSRILETAKRFRTDRLQIGTIGLEPGWHSNAYPCTFTWRTGSLYPNYKNLITDLGRLGYHINLWEHCFTHHDAPFYKDILPYCGDYTVFGGAVPDFATEEATKIFADYHRDNLISLGIDGFKLDECDSSDFTGSWSFPNMSEFPSGLDGEQYHSLLGTLYSKSLLQALGDIPTMSLIRSFGALASSYPFVLYSDLSDFKEYIRALCNSGFSGLLWTPEVRYSDSGEEYVRRLQAGVFSVMLNMNGWNDPRVPWETHGCKDEVRLLLDERIKLIPYLKDAFVNYKKYGIAPARALVSDYTDDPQTFGIDDEYLLGDSLLVAPINIGERGRRVYIPEGEWTDYFSDQPVCNGWSEIETDGIPVYRRVS